MRKENLPSDLTLSVQINEFSKILPPSDVILFNARVGVPVGRAIVTTREISSRVDRV